MTVTPIDIAFRKRGRGRPASVRPFLEEEGWPDPVDFLGDGDMTGAPQLRSEHVPAALFSFIDDTATRMGTDPCAVALAAIVSCASVVTDNWKVQPKRRDHTWTENPRIWGAIVGNPSIRKSPVISACTKPIDRLDVQGRERFQVASAAHKKAHKQWKEGGADPETEPRAPRLDRYLIEGATMEAISEALRDDPEGRQTAPAGKVLSRQDEMSEWLASFDRYRAGSSGSADRGAYLRLYNGGRHTYDRIGRGSFAVPNWSACFIGGIQPGPIQRIAHDSAEDGLLQRFCFAVPSEQKEGQDRVPDEKAMRRYDSLIQALSALTPPRDQHGEPRVVVLHDEAHKHRERIDDLIRVMSAMPETSDRMKAALGKYSALFARIALTFHLIRIADARVNVDEPIPVPCVLSEVAAQAAALYIEHIILPHLIRADAVMFATAQTGHARWIAGYILAKANPRVAMRDIVQAYRPLRAPERRRELAEIMGTLETVGWLLPEDQDNPARGVAAWRVNPKVLTTFAERGHQERERRKQAQAEMGEMIRGWGRGGN